MPGSVLDTRDTVRTRQVSTQHPAGKRGLTVKEFAALSFLPPLHLGTHPFAGCVLLNLYESNLFVCQSLLESLDHKVPQGSELST